MLDEIQFTMKLRAVSPEQDSKEEKKNTTHTS